LIKIENVALYHSSNPCTSNHMSCVQLRKLPANYICELCDWRVWRTYC